MTAPVIAGLAIRCGSATLIPIDRVWDQKPYYSVKYKRHGVNVQVLAADVETLADKAYQGAGRRATPTGRSSRTRPG
jgi:hypothetical protein